MTNNLNLFGKVLKFALDTEISNSNNDEYREHLADFTRSNAYLVCYYDGKVIGKRYLTNREDKHILLGNSKTEVIEEQRKHINITNCFKLFDGFVFKFDISQNNFGYQSDQKIVEVLICPSALGYIANGKLLKHGLDEKSIIWAFCEETNDPNLDHIIGYNGKIYTFKEISINKQKEKCTNAVVSVYKDFASNWEGHKAKFGGSELKVSSSTRYAMNGLLCGSDKITDGLNNQNTSSLKNYRFRDAVSEEDKINQIINLNRRPKFLKDSNTDAVVVGFSDFYINKRIEERFNSDFLKDI